LDELNKVIGSSKRLVSPSRVGYLQPCLKEPRQTPNSVYCPMTNGIKFDRSCNFAPTGRKSTPMRLGSRRMQVDSALYGHCLKLQPRVHNFEIDKEQVEIIYHQVSLQLSRRHPPIHKAYLMKDPRQPIFYNTPPPHPSRPTLTSYPQRQAPSPAPQSGLVYCNSWEGHPALGSW
jgi:hypothetical protein